jgi:Rap1a immunity proteins
MRRGIILAGAASAALLLAARPGDAQVAEQAFRGGRTSDLAALCGASEQESLAPAALGYCQGYFVAAGQYHRAISAEGGLHRPIFCLPNPSPTFDEARSSFVAWARSHPQYGSERAIDGLTRFAAEAYPCRSTPAARPGR